MNSGGRKWSLDFNNEKKKNEENSIRCTCIVHVDNDNQTYCTVETNNNTFYYDEIDATLFNNKMLGNFKVISSVTNMLASMQRTTIYLTAFVHFPVTDNDFDTTRTKIAMTVRPY